METMKAAVYEKYGPPEVVSIQQVTKPVPQQDEVLIKVHATTVSAADWRLRSLETPKGFRMIMRLFLGVFGPRNKVLGMNVAGTIESIGSQVVQYQVGDKVFASCGFKFGGHAEYKVLKENAAIARIPENSSFEEATAICFGGTTANYFLLAANIKRGDKILVNGASGSTGTALVQLAKYYGAEVTAVCSGGNFELVKSIGADHVIDYTLEDFSVNGQTYDIVVDTAGTAPWARSKKSLNKTGRLAVVLGDLYSIFQTPFVSRKHGKKMIGGTTESTSQELNFLAKLVSEGIFTPIIDRVYPFEKIVEAHAYVDAGHKKGNVVITMENI